RRRRVPRAGARRHDRGGRTAGTLCLGAGRLDGRAERGGLSARRFCPDDEDRRHAGLARHQSRFSLTALFLIRTPAPGQTKRKSPLTRSALCTECKVSVSLASNVMTTSCLVSAA